MAEGAVCCKSFVLWDQTRCCDVCHAREKLPFHLKFNGHDCSMCCAAASWATKVYHLKDVEVHDDAT